jgi:hypothetical protein
MVVGQADVPAPFALQHPERWLGPTRCASALDDAVFW